MPRGPRLWLAATLHRLGGLACRGRLDRHFVHNAFTVDRELHALTDAGETELVAKPRGAADRRSVGSNDDISFWTRRVPPASRG
jgi:hypothetical protein